MQTVARPVVLQPTYSTYGTASNCCNTCSTGVSQATYNAPAGSCSSCSTGSFSNGVITGPTTPAPEWPLEPTPTQSNFPPAAETTTTKKQVDSETTDETTDEADDSSILLKAPWMFPTHSDRAASRSRVNRPSVKVWNAVYHGGKTTSSAVSHRRTQAEIDAEGWQAVTR